MYELDYTADLGLGYAAQAEREGAGEDDLTLDVLLVEDGITLDILAREGQAGAGRLAGRTAATGKLKEVKSRDGGDNHEVR